MGYHLTLLFSSPPLSPSERPGGNGMDIRGLCPQPLACACPHLLHIPLCWPAPASADHSPLVDKPHRLLSPPFSPAFLRLEHLSLYTHPPRLSSHPPPPWGCLLRRLHSTDHPDTMMLTQSLARFVVHVILSYIIDCEPWKSKDCVQFTRNLPSAPHRSCCIRSSVFLLLKS